MILRPFIAAVLLATTTALAAGASARTPQRLKVGVVQMAQAPSLAGNRDRIVAGIAEAAQHGARVAVFPEGALTGDGSDDVAAVGDAVAAIRRTTAEKGIYVLFGAATHTPRGKRNRNWMLVLDPKGRDVLHYEKLYDQPRAAMPGVFEIDGIPCNAMICADRWLRGVEEVPIQQGARISFELSNNSSVEWVEPFGWYWYVPRAVRNSVWVVLANTSNVTAGTPPFPGTFARHGHSAVIAPDGRFVAGVNHDEAAIFITEIDVSEATRTEALARASHPALRLFWEDGVKRQAGRDVAAPPLTPFKSPSTDITLAAAQVVEDVAAMEEKIREARSRHADLIVFPARAVPESALGRLQTAARENSITIVFGAEHHTEGRVYNSAFVLGPDGAVLTRYDQLSARGSFQPGLDPKTMWFHVKGVPAVVTLERDGLWTELSELAAAAGAQVHVHLETDRGLGEAALRRHQVWVNLASYLTFTATVNVVDSMIWDDLRALEERRAPVGDRLPQSGTVEVYSQYSANLVARAGSPDELLVATRRVNASNLYHANTIARKNPQMDAWYRLGVSLIQPAHFAAPQKK